MADSNAGRRLRDEARLARGERRILAAVREALAALTGYSLRALQESGLDPAVLDDRAPVWRDALSGKVTPAIHSVFMDAWNATVRGDLIDPTPYGTRHLENVWNRLVGTSDEVFDSIRLTLEAGRQEGLAVADMAREVDALLTDTANWEGRARTIARTEVIGANNAGARGAARATAEYLGYGPDEVARTWLATGDSRTRESHLEADGQTVLGLESMYEVGGTELLGPGAPGGDPGEVINCRCTELFWYPGDPEYDALVASALTAGGPMRRWHSLTAAVEDGEPLPTIVCALPAATDPVQSIGEEQKHATLCYLGPTESVDLPAVYDAIKTWLSLADTAPHTPEGGMVDVTGVESLGDDGARVWMLDDTVLRNLRDGLLGLEPIGDLDAANNDHPDFTAHVTIGYPDEGADVLDEPTETAAANVSRITFDRLAVWAGEEQTEYPLTGSDDTEETDMPEETTASGRTLLARRTGDQRAALARSIEHLVRGGFGTREQVSAALGRALSTPVTTPLHTRSPRDTVAAAAGDPAPEVVTDEVQMDAGEPAPALVEPPPDERPNPDRFHGVMTVEDRQTGDRRVFAPGALEWEAGMLPMPLGWQIADAPGHDGSVICGRIDTIERQGNQIAYTGTWDLDGAGWETRRLVDGLFLRGISVDVDDIDVVLVTPDGQPVDGFDLFMPMEGEDPIVLIQRGRVRSASLCRVPAVEPNGTEGAYIANGLPEDVTAPAPGETPVEEPAEDVPSDDEVTAALVASAIALDLPAQETTLPPSEWFSNPQLDGPTPITITDDGRVYGHLAAWGTCHIGVQGTCVTPPHSQTDYAHFAHGVTPTQGGPVITGLLTMDTGHAPAHLRALPAAAHYDDTGTQFANVCIGEDDTGIWVAGALSPYATQEQIDKVRAAGALSGDWRKIRGNLELVAALAVNTPGFPIPRLSLAASAEEGQTSLVAAGVVTRDVAAADGMSRGLLTYDDVRAMVASALDDERAAEARRGRIAAASATLRRNRALAASARLERV